MITHSADETRAFGAKLAQQLEAGDVLVMRGDLGAGKSELTRGIAAGLGVKGHVTSPTFTIMNVYESGRLPLYHFDWYRIADAEELFEISADDYLYGGGVSVIEWPSMAEDAVPERHLEIEIRALNENEREITLTGVGGFREMELRKVVE